VLFWNRTKIGLKGSACNRYTTGPLIFGFQEIGGCVTLMPPVYPIFQPYETHLFVRFRYSYMELFFPESGIAKGTFNSTMHITGTGQQK
jgi:hypothetical protein